MKKVLIVCTLLAASVTMFAQKKAVYSAQYAFSEGRSFQLKMDKINEAWEKLKPALTHESTKDDRDAWELAAQIHEIFANQIYGNRQNGGIDTIAYFDELLAIRDAYSNLDRIVTTPNAKGKLPRKDIMEEYHKKAVDGAMKHRNPILTGASRLINSHPADAVRYFEAYKSDVTNPLYKDYEMENDSMLVLCDLYIGMAKKNMAKTQADTLEYLKYYEKGLKFEQYGSLACDELMQTYKKMGMHDKYAEFCKYGMDNYKDQSYFPKKLLEHYLYTEKNIDKTMEICDYLKQAFPDDVFAFYTKGIILFDANKFEDAIKEFQGALQVNPEYAQAWTSIGTSYYKMAINNRTKVDVAKKYLNDAIPAFKKAEELAPDDDSLWGDYLYQSYKALNDKAGMAKYKQYGSN